MRDEIVSNGHGPLSPWLFAIHSTANPGATAANHVNYWRDNPTYAVHIVSDWNEAVHTVPYDRLCYQVGNGNSTCIGIEICEATNDADFMRGMEIAREAIHDVLAQFGWGLDKLRSHDWFRVEYGGTDHTDPLPYLRRFGKSWEWFMDFMDAYKSEAQVEQERIDGLPPALKRFRDLWPGQWYIESVNEAVEQGIMRGSAVDWFGVDNGLTRAEAVSVIANKMLADVPPLPFDDIAPWFAANVMWAVEKGIVSGDNRMMRPDDVCTREEFATMLWNAAGKPRGPEEAIEGVSEWAMPAVAWAVSHNVMGHGGNIDPQGVCTRGMAAAMVVRVDI